MLQQIVSHTPAYVWVILAVLVYRGIMASKDRDMAFGKLLIIPAIMLLLSLQDLAGKFGLGGLTLAAWGGAVAVTAVCMWKFGADRLSAGSQAGSVLVRGSWIPLATMMAIFFTKYAASVLLAMQPQARHDTLFVAALCALFGIFNGIFLGRLARDATTWAALRGQAPRQAAAAP